MSDLEWFSTDDIYDVLAEHGFVKLQEDEGFVIFGRNTYPGDDLVLDSCLRRIAWIDLENQLRSYGIDPDPIYHALKERKRA